MPAVYAIVNTVNWKAYIGIVKRNSPEKRFREHLRSALENNKDELFYRAMRKYGPDNFQLYTIETLEDWDECRDLEVDLIKEYSLTPLGYNVNSRRFGRTYMPRSGRKRISESLKKYWSSDREKKAEKRSKEIKESWSQKEGSPGDANRKRWEQMSQEQRLAEGRVNSERLLPRNPNIDRAVEFTGKTCVYLKKESVTRKIIETLKPEDTFGTLEDALVETYPETTDCVNPNGLRALWRYEIYRTIKRGYLRYSDGLPHIRLR